MPSTRRRAERLWANSDAMEKVLNSKRETPAGSAAGALDEAALVRRAGEGDADAFDVLVRAHFPRVFGVLFRLAGNHEDAEDLAQESFVRAFRALRWFRGESAFSTWLLRIAVHVAQDHRRARGRRPSAVPLASADAEAALGRASGAGPGDAALERELVARLGREIDALPEKLRVALVLRVLEGLDYDDVARVTGVTAGTARAQVMKARRQLSRRLGPWLEGGAR